ncbi:hypothetical protein AAKU61_004073 [Undibacterium sp. GrIS 1.2]|uniref:hypothetical protein n=1 Tax=Undibacterium sp. GrIS 1.2 TaxID=3143933 RepID=UPI003398ABE7
MSKIEEALFVISILCRQRIVMLGWRLDCSERTEEVWKNPLDPLKTNFVPEHEKEFLVDARHFESMANAALKAYFDLTPKVKTVFKDFSTGIAPFIEMNTAQRFMSLFHSLEKCKSFANELSLTPEELASDATLKLALEGAKEGVDPAISARIDGLLKKIRNPSIQQQLNPVLAMWSVNPYGLWPLFGTPSLPGLKDIRDKLSHSGPMGVDHQSLDVATRHFSIFVERILIAILEIPLAQTNAGGNTYSRFHRDSAESITELQKQTFNLKKGS